MSIQTVKALPPPYYPGGLHHGQDYANGHNSHYRANGVYPPPVQIHRSTGFPDGTADIAGLRQAVPHQGLSKYRVDPGELKDPETGKALQPDENDVYIRHERDGSKAYFIRLANGDIYQVDGFDPRKVTWHVLDPWTGQVVGALDRRKVDNGWELTDMPATQGEGRAPGGGGAGGSGGAQHGRGAEGGGGARSGGGAQGGSGGARGGGAQGGGGGQRGGNVRGAQPQPPLGGQEQAPVGFRERLSRALDRGIQQVRSALDQIDKGWSAATAKVMEELFGPEASTPQGRQSIKEKLLNTLRALRQSKDAGGANIQIGKTSEGASANAFPNTGDIVFSPSSANMSDQKLTEVMVHEHTHTGAKTGDKWYLDDNNWRHKNLDRNTRAIPPPTFSNAVNNADSIARAATTLAAN